VGGLRYERAGGLEGVRTGIGRDCENCSAHGTDCWGWLADCVLVAF